jgi:hypothetical protein
MPQAVHQDHFPLVLAHSREDVHRQRVSAGVTRYRFGSRTACTTSRQCNLYPSCDSELSQNYIARRPLHAAKYINAPDNA